MIDIFDKTYLHQIYLGGLMEYDYNEVMKLDSQLCFPLYAAARNVTSLYTPFLKDLGLTYTQYITFLVLWEKDGISVSEIGSRLMLDNGTLSPMLKKLEQAGYIERNRSRDDDRVVIITLTPKGRALQERAGLCRKRLKTYRRRWAAVSIFR